MSKHTPFHDLSASANERRMASRYLAMGTPVLIGWLDEGECHSVRSTLKNISITGALIETVTSPPTDSPVLIRLVHDEPAGTVKANIVEVIAPAKPRRFSRRRDPEGMMIRVEFIGPCPYDFFKAAIAGFVVERQVVTAECEGFNTRDWH